MSKFYFASILSTVFVACFYLNFQNSDHVLLRQQKGQEEEKEGKEEERDRPDLAILHEIEITKDPALGYVPRERLLKAMEETERIRRELQGGTRAAIANILWEERGPTNVSGRTRVAHFDLNDPTSKTVWAGSVGGGLWKTTDITAANPQWTAINDYFSNLAVCSFAQDPASPNNLYFGTGEGWFNADAIRGLGIWKSSDGGNTWAQLASTNNSTFHYVQKMAVDAVGNVYACTRSGGLRRSTDGGTTWAAILANGTGGGNNSNCTDFEIASNGDFYAGFTNGTIYKSTDNGTTWTNLTLPAGTKNRMELGCAPNNASVVYCIYDNGSGGSFMRTTDGGATWTTPTSPQMCDQGTLTEFTRTQSWYDLAIAVDPNNANAVFIGGVDGLKSTDGGSTWTQVSSWVGSTSCPGITVNSYVHADHHVYAFAPGSSTRLIMGTDGGIFYTNNATQTNPTMEFKSVDYNVTQFYACDIHPAANSNYFLAGAQDNGSQQFTAMGLGATSEVTGGDGCFCHIDQDNANVQITSYVYQNYYVSSNGGNSFSALSGSGGSFVNPTDLDDANNILYASRGNNAYSRATVPGSSSMTDVTVAAFSGTPRAITVSPNTNHRVFFGTSSGRVVRVDAANTATPTATHINSGAGMPGASVSAIAVEVGNDDHLLVTYSNYGVNSAWETTNGGTNWTSIEGNLPDMPIRWIIFSPLNNDMALVATETGVWTTDNLNGNSTVWGPSVDGLANVSTYMLQYRASDNLIAAATHGRGLYTTQSFAPFNYLTFLTANTAAAEDKATTFKAAPDDCLGFYDLNIPVKLTKRPTSSNATVNIDIDAATTATVGQDFELLTPTLTFATNGEIQQNCVVRIFNDDNAESAENIVLNLVENHTDITSITTIGQHTISLKDNDYPPHLAQLVTSTVGAGTASFAQGPFGQYYMDGRTQMIFTAGELSAAGLAANNALYSMAFNVLSKGSSSPYSNFNIKLAQIAAATTVFATNNFLSATFTTVFSGEITTTTGWNTFDFDTPFTWDGTSNILVEICFDNNAYTLDDAVESTNVGVNRFIVRRADNQTGCTMAGGTGLSARNNTRPNVRWGRRTFAPIQTALNPTVKSYYLGPNETVHFYDNSGNIMASVQNLSAHDFGCTKFEVDRAGTSALPFWNTNPTMFSKTFKMTPTYNNPAASYNLTYYYTQAEANGWMAASGNTMGACKLIKVSGQEISDVTPTTPYVSQVSIATNTNYVAYNGINYALSATFSGFSGGGAGAPGPLSENTPGQLSLAGKLVANHAILTWDMQGQSDVAEAELMRSLNSGQGFTNIARLADASPSNQLMEWTDKGLTEGRYLYRLRVFRTDGSTYFTNLVEIVVENEWKIVAGPNPFTNSIQVFSNKVFAEQVRAKLVNGEGKIVYDRWLTPSWNGQINLNDLRLASGVYTLVLQSEWGTQQLRLLCH